MSYLYTATQILDEQIPNNKLWAGRNTRGFMSFHYLFLGLFFYQIRQDGSNSIIVEIHPVFVKITTFVHTSTRN